MEFRPCIDLHDGRVKQIVGSTLDDSNTRAVETNFESEYEPAWYAKMYQADGLTGGHVIMLGQGNDTAARNALQAYPGGLQVGGGINAANALEWLDAGASQVIVTSWVFVDGKLDMARLEQLVVLVNKERLVLDLSCRSRDGKYYIVTDRWQTFTSMEVNAATLNELSSYCSEFLIHAVDVEGKQAGIDKELIAIMADSCDIPTVYAGGVRSMADIELIGQAGINRIDFTVGSALDIFGGTLPYRQVVEYCS
ncbi:MAG: phosphoribosylformimino-5-aminoimidazole carboxamide ribotide isomerase [Victivallaceae bacterium]|nr:phosphoribosylformimino-5-aminoimidazole carboxamide ribotide isomerase [Victivallaceae bacterium]